MCFLLISGLNQVNAQKLKDRLNKLKENVTGETTASKKDEKLYTSLELYADGKPLTSLQLGKTYQITVVGTKSSGEKLEFSKRTKDDPNQNAHFIGKALGGTWHNTESTLKVMSGRKNLENDSVKITLSPFEKMSEKYTFHLPVFFPTGYEVGLDDERNGFMPAGFIYPVFYPIVNGEVKKENPQYLWNLSEDYNIEAENGTVYKDAIRFDRLPFGLGENDKMVIKAISKKTGEIFFTKEIPLDFSGKFKASFVGKNGEDGKRGKDNYQGIGQNGGDGTNGSRGQNINVFVDSYTHENGKKYIKVKVIKEDGSIRFYSFDPTTATFTISSVGGKGGNGGRGGNGKNTDGKPGNGGYGGDGGQVTMTISPAAKALNPNIILLSEGGNGGTAGPGIGGVNGEHGGLGRPGKGGPDPIIKTGTVKFEITK